MTHPLTALLALPLVWIAAASGRQIARRVCPALSRAGALDAAERWAIGLAVGFTALALGVLTLGLLRLLAPLPVALWLAALAAAGGAEHAAMAREIAAGAGALRQLRPSGATLAWGALALVAAASFGGCLAPPTSVEWDSLSYHLADPKLYVAARRVYYIPWESHSNFAFDMEMLYCVGLLARSMALAKALNFALALAGCAGVYGAARRVGGGRPTGLLALWVYATLPLVFWEAGTAYVDVAAASYAALALLALAVWAEGLRAGEGAAGVSDRWAGLAGVLLGGMLGIKATAGITILLYAAGAAVAARLARAAWGAAVRPAAAIILPALLAGGVWYVKSAAYTGNPVYPFANALFPGRYWDPANSAPYAAAQAYFGVGHKLSDLVAAPWNLTMLLVPGHLPPAGHTQPFNDTQTLLAGLSPVFLVALVAALALPLRAPRRVGLLTLYCVAGFVIWFYLTQQVRYLTPLLPALCAVTAWTLQALWSRSAAGRAAVALALGAPALFGLATLGPYSLQLWGVGLGGGAAQAAYLDAGLADYGATVFLNTQTPPDAKVVTYGEPLTLYLDRPHLWGEPGHSLLIPYARLTTAAALRAYLVARGYRYILLNVAGAPVAAGSGGWAGEVYALTLGSGSAPLYEKGTTMVYAL